MMVQGVREVFEITDLPDDQGTADAEGGDRGGDGGDGGKLVFIGRGLDHRAILEESLRAVLAS